MRRIDAQEKGKRGRFLKGEIQRGKAMPETEGRVNLHSDEKPEKVGATGVPRREVKVNGGVPGGAGACEKKGTLACMKGHAEGRTHKEKPEAKEREKGRG